MNRSLNLIVAAAALLVLAGFLGILIWFVPRLDLGAVVAITLAMVAYDFIRQLRA